MRVLVWTARFLCLIIAVWGMCGFGGDTLVNRVARSLHLSYKTAAFLVSVLVASLGTVSALLPMWRCRESGEQDEE